jgi:twinkle protein
MKIPHSCGSRNGLQVFEKEDGTTDGYCFSCNTYIPDPLKDKPEGWRPEGYKKKTPEEIQQEISEIRSLGAVELKERMLRKETLETFGIKIGLSEVDGTTPCTHFYPYAKGAKLMGYKTRLIENKRMWSTGDLRDVDMFNWYKASRSGARRLYITEGELDAVALYQALKDKQRGTEYAEQPIAVVSLSHGSSSAVRSINRHIEQIKRLFREVVLVFDMDEPGRIAAEEVSKVFPEVLKAELPEKDANDCLIKGRAKALCNAVLFQAAKPKNTRLVWGRDIHEQAKQKAEWGLSYPWEGLTEATRGVRFGETIYIGAGEKLGKSEVVNALAAHFVKEHGLKVMLAKPEESNTKTYKLLNAKLSGKIFHDPKVTFDEAAYDSGKDVLADTVCMLNLYQHITWDTLKGDITYAASEGVKAVFIDPITNLTNGMKSSDINTHLQGVSQELAAMAKDLDIVIFIFCHLNKPNGTPWDRGGKITTDYFAGSSAMARSCNYAIGLEGNKDPELDEDQRNMRTLVLLADREFGESGEIHLYWDRATALFNEVK